MHQITPLKTKEGTDTGLIAVKVPKEAKAFKLFNSFKAPDGTIDMFNSTLTFDVKGHLGFEHLDGCMLRDISIVGLVTPDTIGFDAKDLFTGLQDSSIDFNGAAEDVIHLLLAVNGLYWVNNIKPDNRDRCLYKDLDMNINAEYEWRESKLLGDNNLLILKKL